MASRPQSPAAQTSLSAARDALRTLDTRCCDPGRSPRMSALAATLSDIEAGLGGAAADPSTAEVVLARLEDAGAQIGSLEITCCAPNRLRLYADMLEQLNAIQLEVNRAIGRGH